MAKGKAADTRGLVVEMLQQGNEELMEMLAGLFDNRLDLTSVPPDGWRTTKLLVLFKKGEKDDATHYRPIAMLPIVYKLFSKIICTRLQKLFDAAQTADQAGFRSGFSCEDHLFSIVMIVEQAYEFDMP